MRYLTLLLLLLPACGSLRVDPVNSAQYYQEIQPIEAVVRHVDQDRKAGKSNEQIASDLGWAALQRILAYLSQPPASQPVR